MRSQSCSSTYVCVCFRPSGGVLSFETSRIPTRHKKWSVRGSGVAVRVSTSSNAVRVSTSSDALAIAGERLLVVHAKLLLLVHDEEAQPRVLELRGEDRVRAHDDVHLACRDLGEQHLVPVCELSHFCSTPARCPNRAWAHMYRSRTSLRNPNSPPFPPFPQLHAGAQNGAFRPLRHRSGDVVVKGRRAAGSRGTALTRNARSLSDTHG